MGKIAFLILAHTDVIQLKRLIHSLDYFKFDIYCHIDAKSSIVLNDMKLKESNLYIINNPVSVEWGKISIVNATLKMYKEASNRYNYCRYVTLSGLDYPIISNDKLYNILIDNNTEFICGHAIKGKETLKYNMNFNCSHFWFKTKQKLMGLNSFYILYKLFFWKNKKLKLAGGETIRIYFAPQWHALSGEFVEFLLNKINDNKEILEFFESTFAPDELLIPTIFYNSPFRSKAQLAGSKVSYMDQCLTHELFYDSNGLKIYSLEDFSLIKKSSKYFLRKVKTDRSTKLLDAIDFYRNKI